MATIAVVFAGLVIESLPLLVIGAVAGALVQRLVRPEWADRYIRHGMRSVIAGVIAGSVLPGCAMTTMPLAQSLKHRGAPLGTLTAFIMIAPILSPHTVILNLAMLGWPMTVARIVLPVLMSVALGIALNRLPADRAAAPVQAGGGCGHACKHEAPRGIIAASGSALRQLLPYYLAGLAVVSVLQAFLPADLMARHGRGAWAYAVSLLTAVPLYVCDGAEVPLTAALLKLGIGPGPAFTFLLASVGTCLPTILMAPQIVGLRATLLYVSSSIALALGGGLLFGAPA